MKTKFLTSTVCSIVMMAMLSSCSSSKTNTKKYPDEKVSTPNKQGNLPPGQAKKIYGEKSAKVFAPGQQKKQIKHYRLIIIKTPDIVILRHADGRYFYKNSDNMIYWKGNDDRFYLDEQYLEKVEYDRNELDDWKGKGNSAEKKSPPDQVKKDEEKEQNGKGKEKKKSKND